MLNNIKCYVTNFAVEKTAEYDSYIIMLCKECVPALKKMPLSDEVKGMIELFLQKHQDIFTAGTVNKLSIIEQGVLKYIYIAGCGEGKDCNPNNFRKSAGNVVRAVQADKVVKTLVLAPILLGQSKNHYLKALAEGLFLGSYKFQEFKSDAKAEPVCEFIVASAAAEAEKIVAEAEVIADGVCLARNLINRPGNVVTPHVMAEEAKKIAAEFNLEIEILNEELLKAKNMNALVAVGQGSVHKPCLVVLKYRGAEDKPFTAYVGKGITFDSGGISIKPDDNMGEMKDDMSGAGAVLGAIKAIAAMKLPCNILAVIACAENMPGGNAQRPGDIVKAANGKTIEVISTDAEGRMVLADAVWYACKQGAKKVIDIATLTGAVIIALGKETSAVVSNNDELAESIKKYGKLTGESFWQLPSLPECREAIKSDVADLLNSAGRPGGCITGGLFIGEFIAEDVQWAHLDIGGTSTADKTSGFKVKGGTGFGTLTLINLAGNL